MNKNRLEAFSDGVIAIIITIMVLELKVPHDSLWKSLIELTPVLISYVMSFIFIAIYWGNHHHLLHTMKHTSSGIIWANSNLLFWLSLIPFATAWMGENHFATNTVVVYAVLLLLCGIAFTILQQTIIKNHQDDAFKNAFDKLNRKGIFSIVAYSSAIPLAYYNTTISCCIFLLVAIVWLVPERSIEKALKE
ncbi:MAG: TMEM175 family protein [Bacteroidia bacterium]